MKNKDKYMKQLYALVQPDDLIDRFGVDKETNMPFECNISKPDANKCGHCKFWKFWKVGESNGYCNSFDGYDWLEEEE